MRLIENVCCIILLVFLPYSILEKFGLFRSMEEIIKNRDQYHGKENCL